MTIGLQLSDNELLKRMMEGDEESLAALYHRRQGGIYRFVLQMSGSRALSEDVTQEVFMVLMRSGNTFDAARGSLNSFLLGIARNLLRQRLAREQFYVSLGDGSDDGSSTGDRSQTAGSPLDELSRDETIESVRKAVLSLPPRYREVVVLCDLQEMSYLEAAGVLNCAVGTVRSRLHRGRALLLEKLRPAGEEDSAATVVRSARCFA
jgi:RNA polymerase sigma-70 factor, ECF subfamily